jgi:type III pantothenate kinase
MKAGILAIDAGNTRVKWGFHDGGEWLARGAVDTAAVVDREILGDVVHALEISHAVISNVAGPLVAKAIAGQLHHLAAPISIVSAQAQQCGVVNHYDNPAQLGSDRWAALIAAHAAAKAEPRPQLVVMSGTALTVDALTADGHFLGGIIVPGLMLMHHALNRGTAQLPAANGEYQTFPGNTPNAITSGALEACAGAVERMHARLAARTGATVHCVGSGGAMAALAPRLPFPVLINDNLVLDGLLIIVNASPFP